MSIHSKRGVYFLANDRVVDISIAFLNSFRQSNPEIPLCLIPFRKDMEQTFNLQADYRFTIYNDQDCLDYSDKISRKIHGKTVGHYRKLAAWNGPFDEFLYVDIDTIVLSDIDFMFRLLNEYDFVVATSNIKSGVQWVWKESIHSSGILNDLQIAFAANTGFIASKKGMILEDEVNKKMESALRLLPHMVLYCQEQSFLNYLIISSGRKYSSLYNLLDSELYPENFTECWTGDKTTEKNGRMLLRVKGKDRPVLFIHWAGEWQTRKMEHRIYYILKKMGYRKTIWKTRWFMPRKKLWKKHRYMKPV